MKIKEYKSRTARWIAALSTVIYGYWVILSIAASVFAVISVKQNYDEYQHLVAQYGKEALEYYKISAVTTQTVATDILYIAIAAISSLFISTLLFLAMRGFTLVVEDHYRNLTSKKETK